MTYGTVFDIRRYSIEDGPGIRTTVFFKGCPLRCAWCHNPESQSPEPELMVRAERCIRCGACVQTCPHGAISPDGAAPYTDPVACARCGACVEACFAAAREIAGRQMTVEQVMAEVERDVPFYDRSGGGATFSGGEPLAQPRFLSALLQACKRAEIRTALDTSGYASWETLDRVRSHVDLFLYDLKLMDEAADRRYTGVSNALILDNLLKLAGAGQRIVLRLPVIPGITDTEDNIGQIGAFAAALPAVEALHVLPYHRSALGKYGRLDREYELPGVQSPADARMEEIAQALRAFGLQVKVGG